MNHQNSIVFKFLENAFDLRVHLIEFLKVESFELDTFLKNAKQELAALHPGGNSLDCSNFYENIVGEKHLAELAAWHINSKKYISDTLKLQENFSRGNVIDFGGGIGTHSLANAMSTNVKHVYFVDINEVNRNFVMFRARKLGLEEKISFHKSLNEISLDVVDTIVCLDVLEHLEDPSSQLDDFHKLMDSNSVAIFNWYFYKGENNEYPFHIDDEKVVEEFFYKLQRKFKEIFHPILITTRVYKKN